MLRADAPPFVPSSATTPASPPSPEPEKPPATEVEAPEATNDNSRRRGGRGRNRKAHKYGSKAARRRRRRSLRSDPPAASDRPASSREGTDASGRKGIGRTAVGGNDEGPPEGVGARRRRNGGRSPRRGDGRGAATAGLLECFESVDDRTKAFLLDSLANVEDCEEHWEEHREPLLEPFLGERTEEALAVLRSDPLAVTKAKAIIAGSITPELLASPSDQPWPSGNKVNPIKGAEHRAISLRQLRKIVSFIEEQADLDGFLPWYDRDEHSPAYDTRLRVDTINLYQVVDWLIKPVTRTACCSMVEMLAVAPQRPRWFVSHAWAEPVRDLVTAVAKHAEIRGLSEDEHWWVCGYANNQNKIEIDIDPDPKKTSFYLAMQYCEGVLLCLDPTATPFTRIWCCFEEAMIVKGEKKLLLDIATVVEGDAVVLTDGFVESDLREGDQFALEFKRDRESNFPLQLLERGYDIDIRCAESALELDKRRILNTIAGNVSSNELDAFEPSLDHPSFEKVNKALRGIFAQAAARKAAEAGRLEHLVQVLRDDTYRTLLTLNLGGVKDLDVSHLSTLAGHPSLQHLVIDFSYSSMRDMSAVGIALSGLPQLNQLQLSFAWCASLDDFTPLSSGFASLKVLTNLRLKLKCSGFSIDFPIISELRLLEKLYIDVSYTQTSDTKKIVEGLSELRHLRELTLRFKGCQRLTHLHCFDMLKDPTKLEVLTLDLSYTRIEEATGLNVLHGLQCLMTKCTLNFTKCAQLSGVCSLLPQAVAHVPQLDVNFSECKSLAPWLQNHFCSWNEFSRAATAGGVASKAPSKSDFVQVLGQSELSTMQFDVGENVEYFSSGGKLWRQAVVQEVDVDEVTVLVKQPNGRWYPRRIKSASNINLKLRKLGRDSE